MIRRATAASFSHCFCGLLLPYFTIIDRWILRVLNVIFILNSVYNIRLKFHSEFHNIGVKTALQKSSASLLQVHLRSYFKSFYWFSCQRQKDGEEMCTKTERLSAFQTTCFSLLFACVLVLLCLHLLSNYIWTFFHSLGNLTKVESETICTDLITGIDWDPG